ncbi:tetratricopeptide repeat protein [Aquariibacter albus]|uniref:Tetratricopeptide repeat protein n=1 Tax=Aquariibacter albus TaxID=2759899 RepID=A0A839HFN1_9BURK|nr:tetratricopeptide repeat protein [Aquariibacter albus]MBB1160675.1 tetratricopeptide repeat protein [Aquariibacter albus]
MHCPPQARSAGPVLRRSLIALSLGAALLAGPARAALDVDALWDYAQPVRTEQVFREALARAQGDEALILVTQIARTFTIRGEFANAERELEAIEPRLAGAGVEVRVRDALERGRILRGQGQGGQARPFFIRALDLARPAGLEALTADAMHSVALVEPTREGRLAWHERTIDFAREAKDPRARKWEPAALNNMGITLNEMGRHDLALPVLQKALAIYQQQGLAPAIRGGRWLVAHTQRLSGDLEAARQGFEALEKDDAAAGIADRYVFNELVSVYEARGDAAAAEAYRKKSQAVAR